jgi:hypothetical protein
VTPPERAGGPFRDDSSDGAGGAQHRAPAGAQVIAGRAEIAYRAFVAHVQECTAECTHAGRDCRTAEALRGIWREAAAENKRHP